MADAEKLEADGGDGHGDERLMEGVAVLDFDMLCATVALQTQGLSLAKLGPPVDDDVGGEFSGVQRMWEGDVSDCLDDRRIALQAICCPCFRFGKNMGRAGLGSCFLQGTIYVLLALTAISNYISFIITKRHAFLYLGVAFTLTLLTYLGLFRTQIRKQFNIQEARTLEINNVQDGSWRGRGDTICIGSYGEGSKGFVELHQPPLIPTTLSPELCSMERSGFGTNHSWNVDVSQSEPLVVSSKDPVYGG